MLDRAVVNAGPLVALALLDHLDLLARRRLRDDRQEA